MATRDTITGPLRDRVLYNPEQRAARRANEPLPAPNRPGAANARMWAYNLITCDWCTGMWISAAVVAAAYVWRDTPAFTGIATALTLSHAVGWLAEHE